jgi:dTDP-4-amino-4,6-dideoxygalactose transaminase
MNVPFFDLKRQYNQLKGEALPLIEKVLENTAFSGGPFVQEFEENLAKYNQTKFAAAVNNGTNAIHLGLMALNIGPGDEVIIPANTFIASAWGVSYVGATPVFVDVDPHTWNIDVAAAEKAITVNTKAIMGVHLYGQPCNIASLVELCERKNIAFLEDNAQAIGATYNGKVVGQFGAMSFTSFYPGKNLGSFGEAGAAFTNNEVYYNQIQMLKNHGCNVRYHHEIIGYNMRMEGIQGAVLNLKLNYIDGWNNKRREIVNRYKEVASNKLVFQAAEPNAVAVHHLCVVTTENKDAFLKYLDENGVGYAFHYPIPCHLQKAYASLNYKPGDFPHSEYLASHCISLPLFPEMTDEEISRVCEVIAKY